MKYRRVAWITVVFCVALVVLAGQGVWAENRIDAQRAQSSGSASGLMFVANVGQCDEDAQYRVYGAQGDVWLTDDALWITLAEPTRREAAGPMGRMLGEDRLDEDAETRAGVALRLSFEGGNPAPRIEPYSYIPLLIKN